MSGCHYLIGLNLILGLGAEITDGKVETAIIMLGTNCIHFTGALEKNQWRQLTVSKLKSVRSTENAFVVDPGFNPADKVYGNRVICHVKENT